MIGVNEVALDIETKPDTEMLNAYFNIGEKHLELLPEDKAANGLNEENVWEIGMKLHTQQRGSSFLSSRFHRLSSMSLLYTNEETAEVFSFKCDSTASEREAVECLFQVLQKSPTLITWNGKTFDMAVVTYVALRHGLPCPRFFNPAHQDRFNDYRNRYHKIHMDLKEEMAGYERANMISLNDMAIMCNLPQKKGIGGDKVFGAVLEGRYDEISNYNDIDSIITYAGYLHWMHLCGENVTLGRDRLLGAVTRKADSNPLIDTDFIHQLNASLIRLA